ncbi:MAG: MBL fold metallo-hydrolase [Clostridiales Family XIII bacterium]|jgi:glyoxylase-like metal-dependent hydrolase (beta-lactamase superfamily II)|nr:MBL fold metallo-hydrolase [Clostridiales Family XIII bacterium]
MQEFDFYSHRQIGENFHVVRESYTNPKFGFNIYVVEGSDGIGVFDSGLGATSALRRYIETFVSEKPMSCYATHGDLDHIGGAILFDEAYMCGRDLYMLDWNLNVERRFSDLELFCGGDPAVLEFCRSRYIHNESLSFRAVDDGDVIDLGGVRLEAYRLPGHSAGSLAYYCRERGFALVGDAVSLHPAMQRCTDFKESFDCYERFFGHVVPSGTALYNGHDPEPQKHATARDMMAGFKELLSGKTGTDRTTKWMFKCIHPDELKYSLRVHDTGGVSMIYNANAVREER